MGLLLIAPFAACMGISKEETLLASHTRTDGKKIDIYFVAVDATTKDVIQVRLVRAPHEVAVIKNFDNNYLVDSKLKNDSSLLLVLSDSGTSKRDTAYVEINNK